jgi:hypothetical protein
MKKWIVFVILFFSPTAFMADLRGPVVDATEEIFGEMGVIVTKCPIWMRELRFAAYFCGISRQSPESFIRSWDVYTSFSKFVEYYNFSHSGAWRYEDEQYSRMFSIKEKNYSIVLIPTNTGLLVHIEGSLEVIAYTPPQPVSDPDVTLAGRSKFVSQNYAYVSIRELSEAFNTTFTKDGPKLILIFNVDTLEFTVGSEFYTDSFQNKQAMIGPAVITNGVYVVPARLFIAFGCSINPMPSDPFSSSATCPTTSSDGVKSSKTVVLKRY